MKKHSDTAVVIDQLLQDSYLLVVELQQHTPLQEAAPLRDRCVAQIERVRRELASASVSEASIDHVCLAHCALLDETVLNVAKGEDHATWASEPLQARFFSRHQAGDYLYETLRELLRQPNPDPLVLTVYQRVLTLGFRGRYRDVEAPERAQLVVALNAQVPPLGLHTVLPTQAGATSRFGWPLGASPLVHCLVAGLLLASAWWALTQLLGKQVAALLVGAA